MRSRSTSTGGLAQPDCCARSHQAGKEELRSYSFSHSPSSVKSRRPVAERRRIYLPSRRHSSQGLLVVSSPVAGVEVIPLVAGASPVVVCSPVVGLVVGVLGLLVVEPAAPSCSFPRNHGPGPGSLLVVTSLSVEGSRLFLHGKSARRSEAEKSSPRREPQTCFWRNTTTIRTVR
eukprot:759086-Hanusia_phi.AAC.4